MNSSKSLILLLFFSFILISSCQDELIPEPVPEVDTCLTSFEKDIIPLVTSTCSGVYCHVSSNHFEVYNNIKEVVDNGKLWQKLVVENSMPP